SSRSLVRPVTVLDLPDQLCKVRVFSFSFFRYLGSLIGSNKCIARLSASLYSIIQCHFFCCYSPVLRRLDVLLPHPPQVSPRLGQARQRPRRGTQSPHRRNPPVRVPPKERDGEARPLPRIRCLHQHHAGPPGPAYECAEP